MDKKSRTLLNSLLKRRGLVSKFEKEIERMNAVSRDQYYQWVESVYAISRVLPSVDNDKTREKLEKANAEWLLLVIEESMSPQLDEYSNKYGQNVVKAAVTYMLDNSLWDSPVGDRALKAKMADNYKGLAVIDEVVTFLKDTLESEPEQPSEVEETPVLDHEPDEKEETTDATYPGIPFDFERYKEHRTELIDSAAEIQLFRKILLDMVDRLDKKISPNFQLNKFMEDMDAYNTELAKENMALKQLAEHAESDKRSSLNKLKEKYEDEKLILSNELEKARKERDDAKGTSYSYRKEYEAIVKSMAELQEKYYKLKSDHDVLVKEAQKATDLPRVRVIPMSKLLSLPLMGPKMSQQLVTFFKGYGVVFNEKT